MTSNKTYLDEFIKKALEMSDGNHAKAQRLIVALVKEDERLLRELAQPHLRSIISYALQEYEQTYNTPSKLDVAIIADDENSEQELGMFGQAMLKNMTGGAGRAQNFGFVADSEIEPPSKTSKRHVAAIMQIAKKKE